MRIRAHRVPVTIVAFLLAYASGGALAGAAQAEGCANGQLRSETGSGQLPDCRAYEQVSQQHQSGRAAAHCAEEPRRPDRGGCPVGVRISRGRCERHPSLVGQSRCESDLLLGHDTKLGGCGPCDKYQLRVTNIGDAPTNGEAITVIDTLPPGVTTSARAAGNSEEEWHCTPKEKVNRPSNARLRRPWERFDRPHLSPCSYRSIPPLRRAASSPTRRRCKGAGRLGRKGRPRLSSMLPSLCFLV